MLTLKSVYGVIGGLLCVLYCGALFYYFVDVGGSVQAADEIGLGPTVWGLGLIGVVFCIVLIVRIVRIFITPRTPSSSGRSGLGRAGRSTSDEGSSFDADAVVARYMAQRPADAASGTSAAPHEGGGSAARPSFGRKIARPS
jgi:hypothetical protein